MESEELKIGGLKKEGSGIRLMVAEVLSSILNNARWLTSS